VVGWREGQRRNVCAYLARCPSRHDREEQCPTIAHPLQKPSARAAPEISPLSSVAPQPGRPQIHCTATIRWLQSKTTIEQYGLAGHVVRGS
jgi:hypothetical protein